MRVLVYGTLKRGGTLHRNMEDINANFIKEVVIFKEKLIIKINKELKQWEKFSV